MFDQPILITGCARSGTSTTAGIISKCGAWGGSVTGITQYNRKGQFENAKIRNYVKQYLEHGLGVDPLGQNPLPPIELKFIPKFWKNDINKILTDQGYENSLWYYKGAKLCLIWEIWNYHWKDANWIIVRRNKKSIINSCLNTNFMHKHTDKNGWNFWVEEHEARFKLMKKNCKNVVEIQYEDLVDHNFDDIKNFVSSVGLMWNDTAINGFIDKNLCHY